MLFKEFFPSPIWLELGTCSSPCLFLNHLHKIAGKTTGNGAEVGKFVSPLMDSFANPCRKNPRICFCHLSK